MKPKKIIVPLLAVALIGFLVYNKIRTSADAQKNIASASGPRLTESKVTAYVCTPQSIANQINCTGTVSANNEEQLYSEIAGKITHIYFQEGGKVTKGELLVKINDADLQAELLKALSAQKIAGEIADRNKQLLAKQGISQQDYDQSVGVYDQAKADVALLNAQIAKTEIRSYYNGIIGLKSVSEGTYITPTTKIATIQEIEPVKLDFSIPEQYMNTVKVGDPASFTIQGSNEVFEAKIYAIEPKIDLATRTLLVRAVCPNQEGKVLPGSFASIQLSLKQIKGAIMIPTQAVIPVLKGQQVYVSRGGAAKILPVETGIRNDSTIEITKGLNPGDTVITTGIMMLKPGAKLDITAIKG